MYRIECMTMYCMLQVLELCYGITAVDLCCAEFFDGPEEFPYCLLFRYAGRPGTYVLRVRRRSEEGRDGFFLTDIVLDSHGSYAEARLDWRYVNQSFFKDYAQVTGMDSEVG